ncbi:glycosyltransferase family 4 protein [Vibrio splendidus]
MKRILVVCEVFISPDGNKTVSRSFNSILKEYKKHFDRIDVIGPCEKNISCSEGELEGMFFWGTELYSKKIKDRIAYLASVSKSRKFFNTVLAESQPDIIQFRIPSVFSFVAYAHLKSSGAILTSYISGEWYSSFISNYNFLGNKVVAKALDYKQLDIIKNTISVSAGPEVGEIYKKHNTIYPYFSTTHQKVSYVEKSNDVINLIFLGRLEGLKRVEDGIAALSILVNKYGMDNVVLNLYGDGKNRNILEQQVLALELEDKVKFHGYVNDVNVLNEAYSKAQFLIFPSVSEGTPKVLAEAMSFGVIPVAVGSTGSIRHIIENKSNGILVEAYSPEEIADEVFKTFDSPSTLQAMRNSCYTYAEKHTLENEVARMWEYIFSNIEDGK